MSEQSKDKPQQEHWHLDKRVNVGHLLTTLVLAGTMMSWAATIETRIAQHEVKIDANTYRLDRSDERFKDDLDKLYTAVNRIDDKLDRLIEKGN